jgi:hypothetical protein
MSDRQDPNVSVHQVGLAPRMLLWTIVRGLAIGLASIGAGIFVVFAVVKVVPADTSPCDSDIACLPDIRPLILAICAFPVAIALVGPLVARLLRAPRPSFFAAPAAWATVLACVGLGPADTRDRWPFNNEVSSLLILWIPYGLIALWIFLQQTSDRTRRSKRAAPPESGS